MEDTPEQAQDDERTAYFIAEAFIKSRAASTVPLLERIISERVRPRIRMTAMYAFMGIDRDRAKKLFTEMAETEQDKNERSNAEYSLEEIRKDEEHERENEKR